ncbi:MAG: MOSC domain-containing protein [Chthonomonadales bacterium]
MNVTGFISAICISGAQGMPRPKVDSGRLTANLGFEGNRLSRGGDRQVCLFDEETYAALRADNANVQAGTFGENLTISGIDFASIQPGDQLKCGADAVIEITIARKGCSNLKQFDARLPELIVGRSGWMASVLTSGDVSVGDSIELLTGK